MSRDFRVGVLATIDSPLLPHYLSAVIGHGITDIVVICDSKTFSEKDKQIWKDRTGGIFESTEYGVTSVYDAALSRIPYYFVTNHNDESCEQLIRSLGVDVLLNGGTPRRLTKNIIEVTKHGVLNVHPGLLPKYRGCSAVEWALFNNDKIGNTVHFMTEGYDEGNVVLDEWYEFPKQCDYQSIRVQVYREGMRLAGRAMELIRDQRLTADDGIVQNNELAKYWDPIPDELFAEVLSLVSGGRYKYQCL